MGLPLIGALAQETRPAETDLTARVARCIERLGDDDYGVREHATRELGQIGYPAVDALARVVDSPDREIRYRARRVLLQIREVDFQRRLSAFESERDVSLSHGLPGWDLFRSVCGADYAARSTFIDMQREEPDVMRFVEMPVETGRERLIKFLEQRQLSFNGFGETECSVGSAAAIVFAATNLKLVENQDAGNDVFQICRHEAVVNAITSGPQRDVLRRLFGAWVVQAQSWLVPQALMLTFDFQLPDGIKVAERSLRSRETNPFERHYAIAVVGRLGNTSHIPLLETLLNDTSAPFDFQVKNRAPQLQVRDAALITILQLSNLNPVEFGFREGAIETPVNVGTRNWYLESDEKRTEAINRWRGRASSKSDGLK